MELAEHNSHDKEHCHWQDVHAFRRHEKQQDKGDGNTCSSYSAVEAAYPGTYKNRWIEKKPDKRFNKLPKCDLNKKRKKRQQDGQNCAHNLPDSIARKKAIDIV